MSSSSPTTPEVTVFGLTFEQHDTRLMQEVLVSFERLPSQHDDRVALWSALLSLVRDADANEIEIIRSWYAQSDEDEDASYNADDDGEASEDSTPGDTDEADGQIDGDTNMSVTNNDADSELDEEGKEYYSRNYSDNSSNSSGSTDSNMDLDEATPGDADEADGQIGGDTNMGVTNNEADSELDEEGKEYYSRNYSDSSSDSSGSTDSDMDLDEGTPGSISRKHKRVCVVCRDKRHSTEFPSTKITSTCEHPATICLECLGNYIKVSVDGGAISHIQCPVCAEKLSHGDIKKYASEKIFERYEYLVSRKSMPATYVMCLSPNCNSGQLPAEGEVMMVCNACQFKTCTFHKLPWHKGMTCAEFDALESQVDRLMEEEATAKLLAKISKICPSCKQCITKDHGCDHIECVCGEEWCWVCLAPWNSGHRYGGTVHARTCIYHPESIAASQPNPFRQDTQRLTELMRGGPLSETLQRARAERRARFQVQSDDDDDGDSEE